MAKIDNILLKSKFRGCLLGALIGDCLGAPFEGESISAGGKLVLQRYFDKLDGPHFRAPIKQYTDDTAMTKSVAKCLIDKPAMDFKCMARLFVKEYFAEPRRGYGQNVVEVFTKLRSNKFNDIYKPAQEQFGGMGSYGNGGAMRISPIALYFYNNYKAMIEAATQATRITHTHKEAINGALLQCITVQQSLLMDSKNKMDIKQFTNQLIDKMKAIETEEETDGLDIDEVNLYQTKLEEVLGFLDARYNDETDQEVVLALGNNISALGSVPTAVYCFLKAQSEIPGIKTDNPFRRAVQYAISLGGDTDTIACMTGSIAGAYFGEEYVSKSILRHCEFQSEMIEIADNLFSVVESTNKLD